MRLTKPVKVLAFLSLCLIVIIIICNSRVPFFKQSIGSWSVGYGSSPDFPEKMEVDPKNIFSFKKLNQIDSTSEFLADPFFVFENGKYYVFFEHKHLNYHPAEISLMISDDGVNYHYKGSVLKEKFHLSYPQVFKYKNEYYMVPESQAAKNVLIYKATDFPYGWKAVDTLMANVSLKDPTLYLSDTLNIMAATDKDMNMYLYRADSLFGKWTLHSQPKMLMGSESRPGGRIFQKGNDLILPVQNSSKSYGSGLSLYRLKFKNGEYQITKEKHLYLDGQPRVPDFAGGMHHLDIQKTPNGYYFVYDGINIKNDQMRQEIYPSLKTNFYDLRNWFHQRF